MEKTSQEIRIHQLRKLIEYYSADSELKVEMYGVILDYCSAFSSTLPEILKANHELYTGLFCELNSTQEEKACRVISALASKKEDLQGLIRATSTSYPAVAKMASRLLDASKEETEPPAEKAIEDTAFKGTSGSDSKLKAKDVHGRIDFAIITIRDEEFEAVHKRFEEYKYVRGKNHEYLYCELPTRTDSNFVRVALGRCLHPGEDKAHSFARDMLEDLEPKWLVLTGIAGGFPDDDFTLGDVLLTSKVTDFSVSAVLEGKVPEYATHGSPMHKEIERLLETLGSHKSELAEWNSDGTIGFPRPLLKVPGNLDDPCLYGDDPWKGKVRKSLLRHFPKTQRLPLFTARATASSSTLVKDTKLAEQWRQSARDTANVEMELSGVMSAARYGGDRDDYPVLCVRGISDIVGFKRDSDWLGYACHTAAAMTIALLSSDIITLNVDAK